MALDTAKWSNDRSQQVGSVIVDSDNVVLSIGYNGIPRGCDDDVEERHARPTKYFYFEHAERNAIFSAARVGAKLKDAIIYVTMFPCADCARGIIQSGITKVVAPTPDLTHKVWGPHFEASIAMLKEAGVEIKYNDDE